MKKCFLLFGLIFFMASNSLFSATIYWTGGGAAGVWEDPDNWDDDNIPEDDDNVIIDGLFTVTLSSTQTIESLQLENGAILTIEAGFTLSVFDNKGDGIKLEHTGTTLIVEGTLNSYGHKDHGIELDSMHTTLIINGTFNTYDNGDHGVFIKDIGNQATINGTLNAYDNDKFGVFIDGYDITVTLNGTLNVHNNGDSGVAMDGSGSGAVTLIVNGTLNSYENAKRGMEVERYAFLIIPASGKIYLSDNMGDGIILEEDVTNDGLISITNSGEIGLNTGGNPNKDLINNGTITISGAVTGIDGKDTNWDITNNGTISISNADTLVDLGTDIFNYGTFMGDGLVENGNNHDVSFYPGSTVAPGTSIGKLTFTDILDFSGVNLNIEIDGPANYDQIKVDTGYHGPADVIITGAVLNLSGNYTPLPGDEFMILEKVAPGPIEGTFDGLPEGSILIYKGGELEISYMGGDGGNDITLTFLGALPIELINFNARPSADEVQLNWTTASELNNDYFTIERSADGRNFEAVATINGQGSTTEISKYYHTDTNPLNGLSYYRLKQTDFDGEFSYSDIKTVEFKNNEIVKVYPTLVEDMVTLETNGSLNGEITVIVRDLNGKDCKSFELAEKSEKIELPLNDLMPGSYFITVYDNANVHSQMIVKQ
jgi:hypothetical protein